MMHYSEGELSKVSLFNKEYQREVALYKAPIKRPDKLIRNKEADLLAEKMAAEIIDILEGTGFDDIITVELPYHQPDNFVPTVLIARSNLKLDQLNILMLSDQSASIEIDRARLEPELTNWENQNEDSSDIGVRMIRRVAAIVNRDAPKQMTVHKEFFVMATNWELEDADHRNLLISCGISKRALKRLEKLSFIEPASE
jgi:hypothetical protein